jgi:predicted acetyltransferase
MRSVEIILRRPRLEDEGEILGAARATDDTPSFLHYHREGMPFARWLDTLRERELGVDLPPEHVPSTFLFAFVGTRAVGRASIRHRLNTRLDRIGGHIGYAVVPEFRRKGYATEILRQSLQLARDLFGIRRALVTCDDDNVGSMRVIEKNGGVLENIVSGPDLPKPKRRYWIVVE